MRQLARMLRFAEMHEVLDNEQGIAGKIASIMAARGESNVSRLSGYAARVVFNARKVTKGELSEGDFLDQMGLAGHLDVDFSAVLILHSYTHLVHEHVETKNEAVRVIRLAGWACDNKENGLTARG